MLFFFLPYRKKEETEGLDEISFVTALLIIIGCLMVIVVCILSLLIVNTDLKIDMFKVSISFIIGYPILAFLVIFLDMFYDDYKYKQKRKNE